MECETDLFRIMYKLGIVGFLLWVYLLFKPIFKLNVIWIFRNPHTGVLFISFFGFLHYLRIVPAFIFIMVVFCSILARDKKLAKPIFINEAELKNLDGLKRLAIKN